MRGPMPESVFAEANGGMSRAGRIGRVYRAPRVRPGRRAVASDAHFCVLALPPMRDYMTAPECRRRWPRGGSASSGAEQLSEPNLGPMDEDMDIRRRRAAYRASHRGTKEMDWLLGKFAGSALKDMPAETLTRFEELLALPDPDLQSMILHPEAGPGDEAVAELIARLRAFHGLA